jgi:hypothetical protein
MAQNRLEAQIDEGLIFGIAEIAAMTGQAFSNVLAEAMRTHIATHNGAEPGMTDELSTGAEKTEK